MTLPRQGTEKKLSGHFSFLPEPSYKQFLKLPVQNLSREQWYKQVTPEGKMFILIWEKVIFAS